jgi:PAS domain S-box-containing protein
MLVALLGGLAYFQSSNLWKYTDDMYNHPLEIARSIRDMNADVLKMQQCMNNMVLVNNVDNTREQILNYNISEADFKIELDNVKEHYLGNKENLDSIEKAYNEWRVITDETKQLVISENFEAAYKRTVNEKVGQKQIDLALRQIKSVKASSKIDSETFYLSAQKEKDALFLKLAIAILAIFLLAVVVGILLLRSIRGPLKELTIVTEKYEQGDYNARSDYNSTNEIGALASTFNKMAYSVQSEMQIKEDVSEISMALMTENEMQPFCATMLSFLIKKIEAQIGAVYILNSDNMLFEHFESIGMDHRNIRSFSAETAEGQFGTVLKDKKIHRITNIPSDSVFSLPTISGNFIPREIISIPIIESNNVIAIITMVSIKGFSSAAVRLFEEIMITLTARFNGVVTYQKTKDFAEKIDFQNRELAKSKEELSRVGAYNRSLIEANIDPLVTIGPNGKITDVNAATENVTGRTKEQLVGSDFSDYFTDPELAKTGYKSVFSEGFVRDYELSIQHVNGNITPVLYNASIYRDETGEVIGIFAAARDITERKLTEAELNRQYALLEAQTEELQAQSEELQAQSEELQTQSEELQAQNTRITSKSIEVEEANRLKSEFLSNMSHELRTPLNSIMALSNVLIAQSKGKLNDEENTYLEIIERNGRNLLKLINDILDLSKIEAGKIDLSVKPINMELLLKVTSENIRPIAQKKGLNITLDVSAGIPLVETDESRLQQILTNIIGNAVKFTETGGVTISAGHDNSNMWIDIKDTGIGISRSELPHIFDKFRQVDGSSSRSFEGTGLGLSIVYELVNIIGGDITVDSIFGAGSVFKITLPLKWKGEIFKNEAEVFTPATIVADKRTALVVDDDPRVVREICTYLEELGFNAIGTTVATEAVSLAEKYKPFVITLDVVMPELDGWEVLQRLKKNEKTKDIPVIIVSVSTDKETGYVLGAVGYVTKPIDKEKLLVEIRGLNTNVVDVMVVDDSEIDRNLTSDILDKDGINVIKANGGAECIELLKIKIPDILVLDLMMPEIDGFQVLDYIRSNKETHDLPVVIVTAKDLSAKEKFILSGKVSSILQKSGKRTNDVFDEIKRIINELEKQNAVALKPVKKDKSTVLIIDDDEIAIFQVKGILEKEGFQVDIAQGGKKAIEYFKTKIPDGIILDLMMPEVEGFQIVEVLKNNINLAVIPVIILSAKELTENDLTRLSSANVQHYMQKGAINAQDIIDKVKLMINTVRVPVYEIPAKIEVPEVKIVVPEKTIKGKEKKGKYDILIVEDNPDNMITIKAILGNRYNIAEAFDGLIGLRLAVSSNPDIILLDMALPKMSGMEVFKNIRKDEKAKSIPVIAVTAKAMKHDKEEIASAGFDGYISKPIDAQTLIETIGTFLKG